MKSSGFVGRVPVGEADEPRRMHNLDTRRQVAHALANVTRAGAASERPYEENGKANGEGDGDFKFQI